MVPADIVCLMLFDIRSHRNLTCDEALLTYCCPTLVIKPAPQDGHENGKPFALGGCFVQTCFWTCYVQVSRDSVI